MKNFFYRVCENETALSISIKFGVPIGDLINDNRLFREIEKGDVLYISPKDNAYAVSPFETAETVAEKFNTTSEKILLNNGVPYLFYGLIISV